MKKYENPPIYNSIETLLGKLYRNHSNINKAMRVVIIEKYIITTLIDSMEKILNISFNKHKMSIENITETFDKLLYECIIIESHFSFLVQSKTIKYSFYEDISSNLESIVKQLSSWKKYILDRKSTKGTLDK